MAKGLRPLRFDLPSCCRSMKALDKFGLFDLFHDVSQRRISRSSFASLPTNLGPLEEILFCSVFLRRSDTMTFIS